MKPVVFFFPDDEQLARRLIASLGAEAGTLEWRRFPDRESLVTLHSECKDRDVIVLCSLTDADTKTLPLYFCAATARELGARQIGLVAPYLAYMRQDHRFHPGQSLSAHSYAKLIATSFDWLVTVDPHLHRIAALDEIFSIPAVAVSAMPAVSEWIRSHIENPVLIGPDLESSQWLDPVAHSLGAPRIVLEKTRHGDRHVNVSEIDAAIVRGRNTVIIDDIASSGQTIAEVLKGLATCASPDVTCVVVHALLSEEAEHTLRSAGAARIVSTNTVPHKTNGIDILEPIIAALGAFIGRSAGR
jgi:ribose-phosphate pyrophosphokinase